MAGVYGEINSRSDFNSLLRKSIVDGQAMAQARPDNEAIASILMQLNALAGWTAGGRTPTEDERESIDMAVRASRELEGDDDLYTWTRAIYALDAYVEDWPDDASAASATDDDFFDTP